MAGITVQSFLSAASGMAVAIALIRGFARRKAATVGNFWVDLTRGTLYVLLPICGIAAVILSAQPTSKQPSRRVRPSFRQTTITISLRWRISIEQVGI